MSMDEMHRRTVEALQEKAERSIRRSNNIRPRPASKDVPASTADEIALQVVDSLAETRAYLDAVKTVTDIYRQIVQPQQTTAEELDQPKTKRMYG